MKEFNFKLVKLEKEYFLLDVNFKRMAKDLPEKTLVFCLSETHMEDIKECVRESSLGDNCYSCQPIIATTMEDHRVLALDKAKVEQITSGRTSEQIAMHEFEQVGDEQKFPNHSDKDIWISGFKSGYEKNKTGNGFTLKQINAAINFGAGQQEKNGCIKVSEELDFVSSLVEEETQWDVEVELNESKPDFLGMPCVGDYKPLVTGGYINIIKIK